MTDFERMRTLIRQEQRYKWALEQQMAKATKSTASISHTGGGGSRNGSKVEDGAILLAGLKDEYAEIKAELDEARDELLKAMARIRSPKRRLEKTCLRMRYIQGMSVRTIAYSLSYTEDYLHRKMRAAEALIINIQKASEGSQKKTDQVG